MLKLFPLENYWKMDMIFEHIQLQLSKAKNEPSFIEILFGDRINNIVNGTNLILFGSGALGKELCTTLQSNGIYPTCFCDNDANKVGSTICNVPVISFEELKNSNKGSIIIITVQKYLSRIFNQLLGNGFNSNNILCKPGNHNTPIMFMYAMVGTQNLLENYKDECGNETILEFLKSEHENIQKAYNILADQKSKNLLISKLSLAASNGNFGLFKDFITKFSEPIHEFGNLNYDGTPEDYYYFNNDVLTLGDNEIYLDIGAYDGDTVETFIKACTKNNSSYKKIEAFEPDLNCYEKLKNNCDGINNLNCHQLGLWSESTSLKFITSANTIHDQAAVINDKGNSEIKVVSIDDFLNGNMATLIKMDPGGNIIPEILKGAIKTIKKFKPKLALGAYHGVKSIFEIPILVHDICPEYKIYLRHNTYHLCDTAMYAVI